ncbi:unnamed protein product [Rhizophagus irregularis]|nr:unnamed protein product [Rhizophagus irregularis]
MYHIFFPLTYLQIVVSIASHFHTNFHEKCGGKAASTDEKIHNSSLKIENLVINTNEREFFGAKFIVTCKSRGRVLPRPKCPLAFTPDPSFFMHGMKHFLSYLFLVNFAHPEIQFHCLLYLRKIFHYLQLGVNDQSAGRIFVTRHFSFGMPSFRLKLVHIFDTRGYHSLSNSSIESSSSWLTLKRRIRFCFSDIGMFIILEANGVIYKVF